MLFLTLHGPYYSLENYVMHLEYATPQKARIIKISCCLCRLSVPALGTERSEDLQGKDSQQLLWILMWGAFSTTETIFEKYSLTVILASNGNQTVPRLLYSNRQGSSLVSSKPETYRLTPFAKDSTPPFKIPVPY